MVSIARLEAERINAEIGALSKTLNPKLAEISNIAGQLATVTTSIDARLKECEVVHDANVTTINTIQGSLVRSMQVGELRVKYLHLQVDTYIILGRSEVTNPCISIGWSRRGANSWPCSRNSQSYSQSFR